MSYWRYIFRKEQLRDWLWVLLCTAAGCAFILAFYPFPEIAHDSYDYLGMASERRFWPVRPLGYPVYLTLVHALSHSIYSIVVSQALLYALSLGALLLAVKKYWPPRRRWTFFFLEAVCVLSPAALYMVNAIFADALFCCLIFVMLTMGIVMVKERSWAALAIYLVTFYAALFVKHSAEFFPLAFIPVFLCLGRGWLRSISVGLTIVVVAVFCLQMRSLMYKNTGYRQVSTGFEGWQLANNAIHMLPYIAPPTKEELPADEDVALMHEFLYGRYDSYIIHTTRDGAKVSANFMWDDKAPLREMLAYFEEGYKIPQLTAWVDIGTHALKDYAVWLIRTHPKEFVWYYLWPNLKNAFFPDSPEAVFTYIDVPAGRREIVGWFDFPEDGTMQPRKDIASYIQPVLPWIELFTWMVFLVGAVLWFFRERRPSRETSLVLLLLFLFGFMIYGTTVFASPVALRYWMSMHAVKLIFAWICFQKL
ncbi:MAG: hypothetical protein J5917_03950 [Bacteroidales bacterium]|nr:hypothetical protein [Bacteroidales bacterium]